jgi:hypothetical protein
MNPSFSPVTDLDERRLDRLVAERQALTARLAALDAKEAAFCRRWSSENGYSMFLRPDQIRRAMTAALERGGG